MKLMKKTFLIFTMFAMALSVNAQLAKGLKMIDDERYQSAIAAFDADGGDEAKFYKGYAQSRIEDYDDAIATFNAMGETTYGLIGKGMIAMNNNKNSEAEGYFNAAKKSDKKDPRVLIAISRAISGSKAKDKSKGIEWAKIAVDKEVDNPEYRIVLGDAYIATQDGGQAINHYEYALQFDPNNVLPTAKIGKVYFQSRTYDLSEEYLDKALATDPNNLLALNYKAQILYKRKKYQEAKETQQKILDLGDKSPEDRAMMANILFLQKDYEGAKALINEILSKGDTKYNYLNRLIGYSYFETGDAALSLEFMKKFLETQPKDKIIPTDYEYLAKAMIANDADPADAVNELKKGYYMDTTNKEALSDIASTLKDMKMYDDALEFYNIKLNSSPGTKNDYYDMATMYYQKLDFANAEKYYSKVIEIDPSQSGMYLLRASVKTKLDPEQETASAKEDYEKFVELSLDNEAKYAKHIVNARLYLAKVAIKNDDDFATAEAHLNKIEELDPGNTQAAELRKFLE